MISVGTKIHKLTVISDAPKMGRHRMWVVRCDCGNEFDQYDFSLRSGRSSQCKRCGYASEKNVSQARQLGKSNVKHGETGSPEYKAWQAIKNRCLKPSDPRYPNYGGMGITMHEPWHDDFTAFLAHVGKRPSKAYSIDRLDNDRGYVPGNVAWRTIGQQNSNRRNTRFVEYKGERVPFSMFCKMVNGNYTRLHRRIFRLGWSVEDALRIEDGRVGE
jgi:hypothetical protein